MPRNEIEYSDKIDGDAGNYGWAVRADETDGYLGITQYGSEAGDIRRVLLSRAQVEAVVAFYRKLRPARKRAHHVG